MSVNSQVIWKKEEEYLLKEWADKAQVFRWLHSKSHDKYRWINGYFTIPVIILSTITGAANFSQERIPQKDRANFIFIIGSLNIIAGIISTIGQYLKVAEINEGHRISGLSWGKFNRKLQVELARHPNDRSPPEELIKTTREEYDRLVEISPPISEKIVQKFNKEVLQKKINENKEGSKHAKKNEERKQLDLILPEICGVIDATKVYNNGSMKERKFKSGTPELVMQNQIAEMKKISDFRASFKKIHGREPSEIEININIDKNNIVLKSPKNDNLSQSLGQTPEIEPLNRNDSGGSIAVDIP